MRKNYVLITSIFFFVCFSMVTASFLITHNFSPKAPPVSFLEKMIKQELLSDYKDSFRSSHFHLVQLNFQIRDQEQEKVVRLKFHGSKIAILPEENKSIFSCFFHVQPGKYQIKWKIDDGSTTKSISKEIALYPSDSFKTIKICGKDLSIED
ncbi:MAG: hypothetical protein JW769_01275 [Parachlamydiales bacterium]|nr:hypothetical protein [Parachlamydiales bacterium]